MEQNSFNLGGTGKEYIKYYTNEEEKPNRSSYYKT
jgi:hypothetical protein